MTMLTEEEFATHVNGYCQCGCTEPLIEHDRAQRAEIERLRNGTYMRALEQTLDSERARADKAEAELRIEEEAHSISIRAEQSQRIAEQARAEKYLAAIREWEGADDAHAKKAFTRSYRADTRSRLEAAEAALRAIAEEARRG